MEITIEKIPQEFREKASALVSSVFMQYEAPEYSEEGVHNFMNYIGSKDIINGIEMFGAFYNSELTGVIATRSSGNHITLFFVDGKYHRRGIGRSLFDAVVRESTGEKITVNSSPYAFEIYKKLGFTPDCEEQLKDGLRFTPMTYIK